MMEEPSILGTSFGSCSRTRIPDPLRYLACAYSSMFRVNLRPCLEPAKADIVWALTRLLFACWYPWHYEYETHWEVLAATVVHSVRCANCQEVQMNK